jgi:hypothetical protein
MLSLTLTLDGGEWLTPHCGRFTPGKERGTRRTGGCMGSRAGLDVCGKSCPPHRWSISSSCIHCAVLYSSVSLQLWTS